MTTFTPADIDSGRVSDKDLFLEDDRTSEEKQNDKRVKAIMKRMMGIPQSAYLNVTRMDSAYYVIGLKRLKEGGWRGISTAVLKF